MEDDRAAGLLLRRGLAPGQGGAAPLRPRLLICGARASFILKKFVTGVDPEGVRRYLTRGLFNLSVQYSMTDDRLSSTFAALADPTRRAILARLSLGETTVSALAEPFDMSMPAVSKHLKVLERAGLIERGREAQWRPCRLDAGPLKEIDDWLERYRRFWEESFDRLDAYLKDLQTQEKQPRAKAKSGKKKK